MNDFSGKGAENDFIVLKKDGKFRWPIIPPHYFKKSKNLNKILVLISILVLTVILSLNNSNLTNVEAHNPDAYPIEIFSLWNDTSPILDGTIGFTPSNLAGEWSSAAVYDLYDFQGDPDAKLLLQNDNTHLYAAIDATSYLTPDPSGGWGSTLYFDAEHYGVINPNIFAAFVVSAKVLYT